jgi:hypothetical protein
MKDININYEGLSFEEKITLKINYLYSLPRTEVNVERSISTLLWIESLLKDKRITPGLFIEMVTSRINFLLDIPTNEDTRSELLNLKWVLEIYQENKEKGRSR